MTRVFGFTVALTALAIGSVAQTPKATPPNPGSAPAKPAASDTTTPPKPTSAAELQALAAKPSDMVKVTIKPSRSQAVLGTVSGITATLKNVSDRPLLFRENETMFVIPPEARGGDSRGLMVGCATFVTQGIVRKDKKTGYEVILQPGESYPVFWDVNTDGCQPEAKPAFAAGGWLQRMMFSPGSYDVYLVANYYDIKSADAKAYHTVADSVPMVFTASQLVILFGAFVGGLIAWFVKVYLGAEQVQLSSAQFWGTTALEVSASGMFSVIMVILGSRLSDMFPIKVSADDFWGAIALGFLAQLLGVKLLEKLPGVDPKVFQRKTATPGGGGGEAAVPGVPDAAPAGAAARAAGAGSEK